MVGIYIYVIGIYVIIYKITVLMCNDTKLYLFNNTDKFACVSINFLLFWVVYEYMTIMGVI